MAYAGKFDAHIVFAVRNRRWYYIDLNLSSCHFELSGRLDWGGGSSEIRICFLFLFVQLSVGDIDMVKVNNSH